jgi:dihydroneopterin aldolase
MTGLLASVASVAEAQTALHGCADLVDCKDPRHGALGALDVATLSAIVRSVGGERPVSATTGDIVSGTRRLREAVAMTADCGVDYVKIGLFDGDEAPRQLAALRGEALRQPLIAVCLVDRLDADGLLPQLCDLGFAGAMLDTAGKDGAGLTALWDLARIAGFVRAARERKLLCGLAGRLQARDIPLLLPLGADYLGFRSALCPAGRTGAVDLERLMQLRAAMPFANGSPPKQGAPALAH